MQNALGKHIILELYGCKFEYLDNEQLIVTAFRDAVKQAKMTLLALESHKFEPQGVTAIALLGESHMSIHTYPELGYAAADIFTCGEEGSPDKAMQILLDSLKPKNHTIVYLPRGLQVGSEK